MKLIAPLSIIQLLYITANLHAGWPQWRGIDRNGVAHKSPKITTDFAEDGPKMVWESIEIPSDDEGGHSSVIVAEGKVYLSLIWHRTYFVAEQSTQSTRKLGYRTKLEPKDCCHGVGYHFRPDLEEVNLKNG